MEKRKVFKTVNWIADNLYGDYFMWPGELPFPQYIEDSLVQLIARSIKAKILENIPPPDRIWREEIVLRPPFKCEELGKEFKGTIAWRAELFWEDE